MIFTRNLQSVDCLLQSTLTRIPHCAIRQFADGYAHMSSKSLVNMSDTHHRHRVRGHSGA